MAEASDYIAYLQKMVNLNTIDKMTRDLDEQLQGSSQMMSQIQAMFETIPNQNVVPLQNPGEEEDLYKFLDADIPNLPLPDMQNISPDSDLDSIIASMKAQAENLKKNFCVSQPQIFSKPPKEEIKSLELDQYAASLEQLGKRLANIKLSKSEEVKNRNPELEEKLTQLCQDVNAFTQVVQTKTKLSESNENWAESSTDNTTLSYDGIVSKLLSGINEVTHLLQNSN